jgi:hypothetical protein
MKTTPDNIAEARRVVAQYLESQRERQRGARDDDGDVLDVEAEHKHHFDIDAQKRAAEWADAKNRNLRPLRQMNETNENARAGRDSALSFIEKRKRSVIRK